MLVIEFRQPELFASLFQVCNINHNQIFRLLLQFLSNHKSSDPDLADHVLIFCSNS